MNKPLCHLLLLAALGLFSSSVWCADKSPGGKGKLESSWYANESFKSESSTVIEVSAKYTINWKLWSLMGEPVGDYNVSWKLTGIRLMDPKRKLISSFTPDNLPIELQKAASKIELYIDGVAFVWAGRSDDTSGGGFYDGLHHFNTGTAVRAGAGSSFNMPGSSSWDKIFVARGDACDDKQSTYMDAKAAKGKFIQGIQLSNLKLCSGSGVSELTSLESAIAKLCEKKGADKQYQFCPEQKPEDKKAEESNPKTKDVLGEKAKDKNKNQHTPAPDLGTSVLDGSGGTQQNGENVSSLLDESSERPAIQKQLALEIVKYRRAAEPACKSTMGDINACYAKTGCSRPAESPSVEQCRSMPGYPYGRGFSLTLTKQPEPGEICYREDAECRSARVQWEAEKREKDLSEAKELGRQQSEWTSSYGALNKECQQRSQEREGFASCQKKYDSTCNPKKFNSVDDCVNEQVRSKGPTEKDARKLMQKEWGQRSKTGSSITNSILD